MTRPTLSHFSAMLPDDPRLPVPCLCTKLPPFCDAFLRKHRDRERSARLFSSPWWLAMHCSDPRSGFTPFAEFGCFFCLSFCVVWLARGGCGGGWWFWAAQAGSLQKLFRSEQNSDGRLSASHRPKHGLHLECGMVSARTGVRDGVSNGWRPQAGPGAPASPLL